MRRPAWSARDFSLVVLRALTVAAAGPRLRRIQWAGTLLPFGRGGPSARLPVGDVIGMAAELEP